MTLPHDRTNLSEENTSAWPLKQYDKCLRGSLLYNIVHVPQEESDSEALFASLHVVIFTHACTEL